MIHSGKNILQSIFYMATILSSFFVQADVIEGANREAHYNLSAYEAPLHRSPLFLYDKSNNNAMRYARQAAVDHKTSKPYAPRKYKLSKLLDENPSVIHSFGHGWKTGMQIGKKRYNKNQLVRILNKANLSPGTKLIFHHCSSGGRRGVLEKVARKFPELVFYGNTDVGDGVRNYDIRNVSTGVSLPNFVKQKLRQEFGIKNKHKLKKYMRTILAPDTTKNKYGQTILTNVESSRKGSMHILFREIPVIGFENFWKMVRGGEVDITHLKLTQDAQVRLLDGIKRLRKRYLSINT